MSDRIVLYIPLPQGDRYSGFRTMAPYFVRINEENQVRNLYGYDEAPFNDLRFYAQWERDASELNVYGWHLEYDNVSVRSSAMATRMAKMLRKVESIRAKMPVSPTTFGQFVTLITAALGIKEAVVPTDSSAGLFDYSERKHYFVKIGEESQNLIDRAISKFWEVDHPKTLALSDGRQ